MPSPHTMLEIQTVRGSVSICRACSGSSQNCSFFSLCGEGRRSSSVFGSAKPVLNMFAITLGCGLFLLLLIIFSKLMFDMQLCFHFFFFFKLAVLDYSFFCWKGQQGLDIVHVCHIWTCSQLLLMVLISCCCLT